MTNAQELSHIAGPGKTESSGGVLRKAGHLERHLNIRSQLNLTSWVTVTARYSNTTGVLLDKPVLFPALETMIREHVALAARLPHPPSDSSWVSLSSVDLNKVVTFVEEDNTDLRILLEELFMKPMDFADDMPLWRLFVLRDGMVVFAYDHVLGDGQSGLAFHHALLKALHSRQDSVSGHHGIVATLPQNIGLPPALEDAMDMSVPSSMIVRELTRGILAFLSRKSVTAWTGYPVPPRIILDTTVRIQQYSSEEVATLIKLSREHQATLTGTLHTIVLIVLSRLLYAKPSNKRLKMISTCVPISLRRYTGLPPTALCNHVSPYVGYHPLFRQSRAISRDTFPWDAAAALTETLKRKAPRSVRLVGMLKYVKDAKYLLGQLDKKRMCGLELSNLGAFPRQDDSQAGPWNIRETLFTQADSVVGAALKLNVVGSPVGGLGVTVTWGKDAVDHEFAEEFVKGFEEGMKAMVG